MQNLRIFMPLVWILGLRAQFGALIRVITPVVFLVCCLTGCTPSDQVETSFDGAGVGRSLLDQEKEIGNLLSIESAPIEIPFSCDVYVDLSMSMRGYVESAKNTKSAPGASKASNAKSAPQKEAMTESGFFHLLRQLANQGELQGFYSFGIPSKTATVNQVTFLGRAPPLDAEKYQAVNNDYAQLISAISDGPQSADGKPLQHVIITDGVQSHQDERESSSLSRTVSALKGWVDAGKVVDIKLISSPFSGTYYSEELRARNLPYSFPGRTPRRPFLVISLLSDSAALLAWDAFWDRSAFSELEILGSLRYPQAQKGDKVAIEPQSEIPKDVKVDTISHKVWDLVPVETLDGFASLWHAQLRRPTTESAEEPTHYPACFKISNGSSTFDLEEFKKCRPVLQIWRKNNIGSKGPETNVILPPDGPQVAKGSSETAPPPEWILEKEWDLRQSKSPDFNIGSSNDDSHSLVLLCQLPLTPRGAFDSIVIQMNQPLPEPEKPDFSAFSTLNDATPATLDRIYNLQPLIEQFDAVIKRTQPRKGACIISHWKK